MEVKFSCIPLDLVPIEQVFVSEGTSAVGAENSPEHKTHKPNLYSAKSTYHTLHTCSNLGAVQRQDMKVTVPGVLYWR